MLLACYVLNFCLDVVINLCLNVEINLMKNQGNYSNEDAWETDLVTAHLEKIIKSDEFESAARLREFLNYVVEQKLAGHSKKIRAKTILFGVYNREADGKTETEAVVRVDAGRPAQTSFIILQWHWQK